MTEARGYDEAARGYLRALSVAGFRDLALSPTSPIQWSRPPFSSVESRPLAVFRGIDRDRISKRVHLVHTDPTSAAREAAVGLYNICLTVWETDQLAGDAVFGLNGWFGEVWVPSRFCAEVLKSSGVTVPVHVVPHVLPGAGLPPVTRPAGLEGRYVFYFVGSRNPRKNPLGALRAYLAEFNRDEPVAFVCKTWSEARWDAAAGRVVRESTSIEVERLLAEVGKTRETAPRLYAVDREIEREEVLALHAIGDCFVSAHRGEGFGLALLEARHFGRPCIATGWGGPCDFLDFGDGPRETPTDIGVPYELVPVSEMDAFRPGFDPGQKWAEPSDSALRAAMRRCFSEQRRNISAGRTAEFAPAKVGARMVDLITRAEAAADQVLKWQGGRGLRRPRVVLVTTFNERCGVAYYAEHAARALIRRGDPVEVLAPLGSEERDHVGIVGVPYRRAWRRASDDAAWLPQGPPGIVHLQHEFSFWPDEVALCGLLDAVRARGWASVVTLHTVLQPGTALSSFFKAVARKADCLTALGEEGAKALRAWCEIAGAPVDKVFVTRNVCAPAPWVDRTAARAELGVLDPEAFLCVTPGFMGQSKRIGDCLVGVGKALAMGLDPARFGYLVCGGAKDEVAQRYFDTIAKADLGEAALGCVTIEQGFLDLERYERVLAAADCVLLFHRSDIIYNSSVVLDAMRFGKATISAKAPASEYLTEEMSLKVSSSEEIARALLRLARDVDLRRRLGEAALEASDRYQPDNLGEDLAATYQHAVRAPGREAA